MSTNFEDIQSGGVPSLDPMADLGGLPNQITTPFQNPIPTGAPPPEAAPPPLRPQTRQERLQRYQDLITNFTFSLGSGMLAAAHAPPGARNRTMAGAGAALVAPLQLQKAQEALALQKQQEETRAAQLKSILQAQQGNEFVPLIDPTTGVAFKDANGQPIQVPRKQYGLEYAKAVAQQNTLDAKKNQPPKKIDEFVNAQGKRVLAMQHSDGNITYEVAGETAAKYKTTPEGLFDISTGTLVPGTGKPDDRIEMTDALVKKFGLQQELVGENLRASDINSLVNAGKPNTRIVTLEDGVYSMDLQTGAKERLGDRPRSSAQNMGGIARVMNPVTGEFAGWAFPDGRFVPPPQGAAGLSTTRTPQGTLTRNELLQDIDAKLQVIEAAAKNHPAVIGGAFGVRGKLGSLGNASGILSDPEISDIFSLSEDLSDQRLRQRSGAAINDSEMRRITRFSPNATSQTSTVFLTTLRT